MRTIKRWRYGGIYFLVLEAGPLLIVGDGRGDATLLLDRGYRVFTAFVVP